MATQQRESPRAEVGDDFHATTRSAENQSGKQLVDRAVRHALEVGLVLFGCASFSMCLRVQF
jgi:hypothetical protein